MTVTETQGKNSQGPNYYGTLAANSIDMVTMMMPLSSIEVVNRDGAGEIFYTIDGSTPSIEGVNSYYLPAIAGAVDVRPLTLGRYIPSDGCAVVKLVSNGTPKYAIVGS